MTLHEAIIDVLREKGTLKAPEIARLINERNLYQRNDGNPVPSSQIHARIGNYPDLFTKNEGGAYELHESRNNSGKSTNYKELFKHLQRASLFSYEYALQKEFIFGTIIHFFSWVEWQGHQSANPEKRDTYIPFLIDNLKKENDGQKKLLEGFELIAQESWTDTAIWDYAKKVFERLHESEITNMLWPLSVYSWDRLDYAKLVHTYFDILPEMLREERSFFSAPSAVFRLMAKILSPKPRESVYDPCMGTGLLLHEVIKEASGNNLNAACFGEELSRELVAFAQLLFELKRYSVKNFTGNSTTSGNLATVNPDCIISELPIGRYTNWPAGAVGINSKDATTEFLKLILKTLKPQGRAVLLVWNEFLFKPSYHDLRTELVDNDWLEAVVGLPEQVGSSIVVMNKNKHEKQRGRVRFMQVVQHEIADGETDNESSFNIYSKKRYPDIGRKIDVESSWQRYREASGTDAAVALVENSTVADNDHNLVVSRYTNAALLQSGKTEVNGKQWTKLQDILLPGDDEPDEMLLKEPETPYNTGTPGFIGVKDLAKSDYELYLKIPDNSGNNDRNLAKEVVKEDAVLVGNSSDFFRPTFFKARGKQIAISNKIIALRPDSEKIDPVFLTMELKKPYVQDQLRQLSEGKTPDSFSEKGLQEITINLPPLEQQRALVQLEFDALLEAALTMADEQAAQTVSLLSKVKHSVAQRVGALRGGLDSLRIFLDKKEQSGQPFHWNDLLLETRNITLNEHFGDLNQEVDGIRSAFEKMSALLKITEHAGDFRETDLQELLVKLIDRSPHAADVVFNVTVNAGDSAIAEVDRFFFTELFTNIIENASNHAYEKDQPKGVWIHFITLQDNKLGITYMDNGRGLPEGFTFEDMLSHGQRGGNRDGSGIGGNIIALAVRKHHGTIDQLKSLLTPGLKFVIQIPKKHELDELQDPAY